MSLIEQVEDAIKKELERVTNEILVELKEACPKQTGTTARSIHIEKESEFANFIGSRLDSMYYADQGSGATGKFIAFVPYGGIDRSKRPYGKKVYSHGRKGYEGAHFVEEVANRHR